MAQVEVEDYIVYWFICRVPGCKCARGSRIGSTRVYPTQKIAEEAGRNHESNCGPGVHMCAVVSGLRTAIAKRGYR